MKDRSNFHLVPYDYTVILIMLPTKKSSFPHTDTKCCGADDNIDICTPSLSLTSLRSLNVSKLKMNVTIKL